MKTIEELLSRFHLIEDPSKNKLKIVEILNEILKIDIKKESVEIKGSKVTIILEPTFKSYLFTKQKKLLELIEGRLMKNNIKILFK